MKKHEKLRINAKEAKKRSLDLGLVIVYFDQIKGPVILVNHSSLDERELFHLSVNGTSSMMSGVNYGPEDTHRFRGIFPVNDRSFAYCFDSLITVDQTERCSYTPILLFVVFPSSELNSFGLNIKSVEMLLTKYTVNRIELSRFTSKFCASVCFSITKEFQKQISVLGQNSKL